MTVIEFSATVGLLRSLQVILVVSGPFQIGLMKLILQRLALFFQSQADIFSRTRLVVDTSQDQKKRAKPPVS